MKQHNAGFIQHHFHITNIKLFIVSKSKNKQKNKSRLYSENSAGFTLIETLLYIVLFAIVIGGGMVAIYQIIQSTDATYNHVILQEEANFLFRKIDWALTGATTVTPSSTLVVTKLISGMPVQLTFASSGNNLTLQRNSASSIVLNSSSIAVSAVLFTRPVGAGSNSKPDAITTSFTLTTVQNGANATQDFSITKYLRK